LILRTNDPEKIKRGLNLIIKTAEDGARTVKRIQDFARQRRDHDFKPVAIDQILLDVSEVTRPLWKDRAEASNVQISLDLQIHSKSRVMGDDSELREVLVNMVFNAVDAMPAGGTLTLTAADVDGSVVISVGDTGIGMAPEVKSRIFDPFFTTKGKAGMGLGLAVSFGIVRRHEGSVAVDSELGKGTTFRIVLPAAQVDCDALPLESEFAPAVNGTADSSATDPSKGYQPSILVVDDEEGVRELLRDLVESEGCRVRMAASGRDALSLFGTQQFDAIFTDVGMPGMSGWELANAIRERNEKIPIAVITGWGEAVGSDEQREARVDWVVTKPFRAERISELVREISARSSFARRSGFSVVAA
jgi:CheY-like chemotaxis protein